MSLRERMSERVRLEFFIYTEIRRDINPIYNYIIITCWAILASSCVS